MAKASGALGAAGNSVVLDVREANAALAHLVGGTVNATGVAIAIEGTLDNLPDVGGEAGAKWFGIDAARTAGNVAEGPTVTGLALNIGVALAYGWKINTVGIAYVRIRVTAITGGNVVATIIGTRFPAEAAPVRPTTVATTPPTGTSHNVVTTASTNFASLVTTGCNLDELTASNPTATPAFVKVYNKATAPTTSDVPILTVPVPANSVVAIPFGPYGKRIATGLGIGVTGAIAANDATSAPVGVVVNLTRH